jgi:hypothetical protein
MNFSAQPGVLGLVFWLACLAVSGCAGTQSKADSGSTIHVATAVESSSTAAQAHVALRMAMYSDRRPTAATRKVGDIRATVVNMHQSELVLDQDISSVVTAAIGNALAARGFQVSSATEGPSPRDADVFQVSGSVRTFALDIGGRDQLAIAVETTLREGGGKVLWSGVVSEAGDRYAGVSGNTKDSIARYLASALKTVAEKTSVQVSDAARGARPDLFAQTLPTRSVVPGVEVIVPAAVGVPPQPRGRADDAPTLGRLSLTTTPPRAKVYLGDVYWGLSPLDLDLAPDIYSLRVTLDGFKPAREKVSVRRAVTTELEITLER